MKNYVQWDIIIEYFIRIDIILLNLLHCISLFPNKNTISAVFAILFALL